MFANVVLNLHPGLGIRLDLLTIGTDQKRATKRFDFVQRSLEPLVCRNKTIQRLTTLAVQHGNHCRKRDEDCNSYSIPNGQVKKPRCPVKIPVEGEQRENCSAEPRNAAFVSANQNDGSDEQQVSTVEHYGREWKCKKRRKGNGSHNNGTLANKAPANTCLGHGTLHRRFLSR